MAEKNNATCAICGKGYYMCASCKDKMSAMPWKIHTDTSEHYKVFQIVRGYSLGVYDKIEAKDRLKNVDLSDIEVFKPEIKKIVKDIMNDGESEKHRSLHRKREMKPTDNIEIKSNVEVETDIKHDIVATEEVDSVVSE